MYLSHFNAVKVFACHLPSYSKSRDSSVGIVTGYGLDDRGLNPDGGWEFFSSPPCLDRLWGPPNFLSKGYGGAFPGGKAAGA
jgi:hypothetical protein